MEGTPTAKRIGKTILNRSKRRLPSAFFVSCNCIRKIACEPAYHPFHPCRYQARPESSGLIKSSNGQVQFTGLFVNRFHLRRVQTFSRRARGGLSDLLQTSANCFKKLIVGHGRRKGL